MKTTKITFWFQSSIFFIVAISIVFASSSARAGTPDNNFDRVWAFCNDIEEARDVRGYRHESFGSAAGSVSCALANVVSISWVAMMFDALSGTARASNSQNSAGSSATQDKDLKRLLEVIGPEANQYLIDGKLQPGTFLSVVELMREKDPSINGLRVAHKVAELNRDMNSGPAASAGHAE
ncbi:MAG: hypothetical protein AABZ55_05780 [Bdellovibrionota bacterium]